MDFIGYLEIGQEHVYLGFYAFQAGFTCIFSLVGGFQPSLINRWEWR